MTFTYPVFAIGLQGNYVAISTPESSETLPQYGLLLFPTEEAANDFVQAIELENSLVQAFPDKASLQQMFLRQIAPITQVAWDTRLLDGNLTTACYPMENFTDNAAAD